MSAPLRVGISACIFHTDPTRPRQGRTLLYLEQSLGHWLQAEGVLVFLLPTPGARSRVSLREMIAAVDGLVLQGGVDVAPSSYGESPLDPEWAGDAIRDAYEIALVEETMAQRKPVLGICRGAQLLNVALGGTLYQDIPTQLPHATTHRDAESYDRLQHGIRFEEDSWMRAWFPDFVEPRVNSLHHQAIKTLGRGVRVEARSSEDGVIEAVRYEGESFGYGFQWHPEFHAPDDRLARRVVHQFIDEALGALSKSVG